MLQSSIPWYGWTTHSSLPFISTANSCDWLSVPNSFAALSSAVAGHGPHTLAKLTQPLPRPSTFPVFHCRASVTHFIQGIFPFTPSLPIKILLFLPDLSQKLLLPWNLSWFSELWICQLWFLLLFLYFKAHWGQDFGIPVVKTSPSTAGGHGFNPWLGN